MTITPKITAEVQDCEYLKIIDTTVYSQSEPKTLFGRAYFAEIEGLSLKRADLNNLRSQQVFLPIIRDGLHKVYMALAPGYERGATYAEGSVVVAIPGISTGPGDPPIEYSSGYNPGIAYFYIALTETDEIIDNNNEDWEMLENVFDSLALFQADPLCKVAEIEESVDCVTFNIKRTGCRTFDISKMNDSDYAALVYSMKSYLSDSPIYSFTPLWQQNKAVFDFNQIAPADISNIYVIKLSNPSDRTDFHYLVVYDLCKALECYTSIILDLLCKECEGCTPSKEETYRRFSLNRMSALFSSIMMSIHQSEFANLGEAVITDSRYASIKDASEKLEMFLELIYRCGECSDKFENCIDC